LIFLLATFGFLAFGVWATIQPGFRAHISKHLLLLAFGWLAFIVVFSIAAVFNTIESAPGEIGILDAAFILREKLILNLGIAAVLGFFSFWQWMSFRVVVKKRSPETN